MGRPYGWKCGSPSKQKRKNASKPKSTHFTSRNQTCLDQLCYGWSISLLNRGLGYICSDRAQGLAYSHREATRDTIRICILILQLTLSHRRLLFPSHLKSGCLSTYPPNPSCKSVSTKLASLQPLLKAWSHISSSSAKIRLLELLFFEVSLRCPVCIFHSGQPSKGNFTRELIKPLWKGGDAHSWKSVLTRCCYQRNLACFNDQSASTCTPQVPRSWLHRENRKGPAFLGRPGLKGFMKPLHMKQTGSKKYCSSHHQILGIAPSVAGIPELIPSLMTFYGHIEITTDVLETHLHVPPQTSTGMH